MRRFSIALVFLSLVSCASDPEAPTTEETSTNNGALNNGVENNGATNNGTNNTTTTIDEDRLAGTVAHRFGKLVVGPGEEDTFCGQWHLNNDEALYVNKLVFTTDGGFHHSNWFAVPEDAFEPEEEYFECGSVGFSNAAGGLKGTVIFAQSTQSFVEKQAFPEGVVVKIPPRSRIIASMHTLNLTTTDLETTPRMTLDVLHPKKVETVLSPTRLGYRDLNIPPRKKSHFTGECKWDGTYEKRTGHALDQQIYWVLPHYHYLGNYYRLEIFGGPNDGHVIYELSGFNAEANGQMYDPPIDLSGAEGLRFTCGYDNPRNRWVGYGIGDQEMCEALVLMDSKATISAEVFDGDMDLGDDENGVSQHTGPCGLVLVPNDEKYGEPTEAELDGELYLPDSDVLDDDVAIEPKCEDTPVPTDTIDPGATLTAIRDDVFEPSCTFSSCHDADASAFGLDLTADDLHAELMDHEVLSATSMPLVTPGDPDASWLYQLISKCEPQSDAGPVGHMPRNSPKLLPKALVERVHDWIADGAQDN
jgi:hypothetical protein